MSDSILYKPRGSEIMVLYILEQDKNGWFDKWDLGRATGLPYSTIYMACRELENEKWIIVERNRRGVLKYQINHEITMIDYIESFLPDEWDE